MARAIEARLGVSGGGEAVALARGASITWGMAYGASPQVATFETSRSIAQRIWDASRYQVPNGQTADRATPRGPLVLTLRPSAGRDRVFSNLYALELLAGSTPNFARLTFADSRWLWRARVIERLYNARRNGPSRRLVGGELERTPIQLSESLADAVYRRSSLNPATNLPWTPSEVAKDVLEELAGTALLFDESKIKLTALPDGFALRDFGPAALARVFAALPGLQVYQDEPGRIRMANLYDGSEAALAAAAKNRQHAGDVSKSDRSRSRFRVYSCYMPRRQELRFDVVDPESTSPTGSIVRGQEELWAHNVVPCPLYRLELPSGRTATLGEYIKLADLIAAFNTLRASKGFGATLALSEDLIRKDWLGNWPELQYGLCLDDSATPDLELSAIFAAIRSHWRQTFRLLPQWIDKVAHLEARRAAVADPENNVRPKSPVFCDYIQKLSQAGLNRKTKGRLTFEQSDWAEDLANAKASPFDVEVLDSDQGVFRIVPRLDQAGLASEFVIGQVTNGPVKSNADEEFAFWHQVELVAGLRLSVILTAKQDSPNDLRRLQKVTVTAREAADKLGYTGDLGELLGPDQEEIIQIEEASFAWLDSEADLIRGSFYGVEGGPTEPPQELWANREFCVDAAEAAAARSLSIYLDRWEGTLEISHLPALEPTGNLRTVVHTIALDANGLATATTRLDFPLEVDAPDSWGLMSEASRRYAWRQVVQ